MIVKNQANTLFKEKNKSKNTLKKLIFDTRNQSLKLFFLPN